MNFTSKFLLQPKICALVCALWIVGALAPAHAQTDNPILVELRPLLQQTVREQAPDAVWELKGNELTAQWKTREFTIYSILPGGDVAAQAHQEIGPRNGGFILRVRVFSELPDFAFQTPSAARQAYWRTDLARYNLRASGDLTPRFSGPSEVQSEREFVSMDRPEFTDVPLASYALLNRVRIAGLFQGYTEVFRLPTTRYEAALALNGLMNTVPDLKENKAVRLRALEKTTVEAGQTLSPTEIEALDTDIRDLQLEFQAELARLTPRTLNPSILELRILDGPEINLRPNPL